MGNHEYTTLDRARDELFSHIQRCEVLETDAAAHVREWLDETMEFMSERYPDLTDLQLAQLRMMGERYLEPVIPHGQPHNALNRRDFREDAPSAESGTEPEATDKVPEGVEPPEEVIRAV